MNERIKELAEQCGFRSNPDIYDRNQSFDIPKFAELIVERLCYDMMDVCGATQAERIQFVAKNWGVEL